MGVIRSRYRVGVRRERRRGPSREAGEGRDRDGKAAREETTSSAMTRTRLVAMEGAVVEGGLGEMRMRGEELKKVVERKGRGLRLFCARELQWET